MKFAALVVRFEPAPRTDGLTIKRLGAIPAATRLFWKAMLLDVLPSSAATEPAYSC